MHSRCLAALLVLAAMFACARPVPGQSTPAAGGHVHYAEPAAAQPAQASPSGALAPRLQNLGAHTFPVSTRNGQVQAFINQVNGLVTAGILTQGQGDYLVGAAATIVASLQ